MFLKNSDTDHFTDLIRAFWAIDPFSDLYTFGCVANYLNGGAALSWQSSLKYRLLVLLSKVSFVLVAVHMAITGIS